jgi:signal transduction histidine kinase
MRGYRLSIRGKVTLALGGAALVTCALVTASLGLFSRLTLEGRARQIMEPCAQLVSVGTEAAVEFQDPTRAGEVLSTLRANPQMVAADIVLPNGRTLASYSRGPLAALPSSTDAPDGLVVGSDQATWSQHLPDGARLRLVMSLDELKRQTWNLLLMVAGGVLGLVVFLTIGLRIALQRTIVQPISTLVETVEQVRARADYGQRVPTSGNDEVALLGRSFNAMMEGIDEREKKLQRLNAELEGRVADRTRALEMANGELEAFCYSVSHDLRAPLRHIDGYVQLLVAQERDHLHDKGLHYLDTIANSVHRMGSLIDDLLRFSRTTRAEMSTARVDMNRALDNALGPLKETCGERSIEWSIGNLPAVRGDVGLLRQVWANLLENAVKYTRTKDVARIEVTSRDGDGETVFSVSDNGVGFDMKYASKLFGVFQRLHSQDQFDGTGIGLATVQRIIKRHGGRVWAEAQVGRGATFYFALPKADQP